MPQQGLIFRALIASPGDCEHERKIIPEVIRAWNATHSKDRAAIVEAVLWETHSRPELGDRPQQIINRQIVSSCDLLVGAFWTRLGTPTGKSLSGTAEEIEEFRSKEKPVMLYFSTNPVTPDSIDHEQYNALTSYRNELGKSGLYFSYSSLPEFREIFQNHFSSQMIELLNEHGSVTNSIVSAQTNTDDEQEAALRQFISDYQSFVRRFEAEWRAECDSDPVNTQEAKYIIQSAQEDILHFKSMITSDGTGLGEKFSDLIITLRKLQRHTTSFDSGVSFKRFWETGDDCLNTMKNIATEFMSIDEP